MTENRPAYKTAYAVGDRVRHTTYTWLTGVVYAVYKTKLYIEVVWDGSSAVTTEPFSSVEPI